MRKEIFILDNEIQISKGIMEDIIPIIGGNLNNTIMEDDSLTTINWKYKSQSNSIICKSELYKQKDRTKIINEYMGDETAISKLNQKLIKAIEEDTFANMVSKTKENNYQTRQKTTTKLNDKQIENYIKYFFIGIAVICFGFYFLRGNDDTTSNSSNSFVTQTGYKASFSEEALQRLVTYSVHKDYAGINHLIINNEIFELPAGKRAYVIKSKLGRVKIKLYDEQLEVWTFTEAIKKE